MAFLGRRKSSGGDDGDGPPAWIVSFTDMVTLLLAFFVLLQAFANVQDPELFFIGRDSFKRAIAGLGIPGLLLGKQDKAQLEHRKPKHPTEEADKSIPKNRAMDVEDEKIRKAFEDIRQAVETRAQDVVADLLDKRVMPVAFPPGRAELSPEAETVLADYAADLRQNLQSRPVLVCVVGFAPETATARGRWMTSAARAKVVREFLQRTCADVAGDSGWQFRSWGDSTAAATGAERALGPSHITIVITEEGVSNG